MTIDPAPLKANEFRISDVPPGSVLLVGSVAVFNVDGRLCATQAACRSVQATMRSRGCPYNGGNPSKTSKTQEVSVPISQ